MDGSDPDSLIEQAQEEHNLIKNNAQEALEWFLEREGDMFNRREVKRELADHLDVEEDMANAVISTLVGDIVDPVQQVSNANTKHVGVIEYDEYPDEGSYSYIDYHDVHGKRKRVVCARCVEQVEQDNQVAHATTGEGTADEGDSWEDLRKLITSHYADAHSKSPEEIQVGATLLSGTTIAGNTAVHLGNESFVDEGGDTMSGNLAMATNLVTNVGAIDFDNIEDVATSNRIGIDQSVGMLIDWGQGTAAVFDGNNVSGGSNISISNATGNEASPSISVNQGSGSGLDADTVDGQEAADIGGGISGTVVASGSVSNFDWDPRPVGWGFEAFSDGTFEISLGRVDDNHSGDTGVFTTSNTADDFITAIGRTSNSIEERSYIIYRV